MLRWLCRYMSHIRDVLNLYQSKKANILYLIDATPSWFHDKENYYRGLHVPSAFPLLICASSAFSPAYDIKVIRMFMRSLFFRWLLCFFGGRSISFRSESRSEVELPKISGQLQILLHKRILASVAVRFGGDCQRWRLAKNALFISRLNTCLSAKLDPSEMLVCAYKKWTCKKIHTVGKVQRGMTIADRRSRPRDRYPRELNRMSDPAKTLSLLHSLPITPHSEFIEIAGDFEKCQRAFFYRCEH